MSRYKITKINYKEERTSKNGQPFWITKIEIADKPNVEIGGLVFDKRWASVGDEVELTLKNDPKYGPQFEVPRAKSAIYDLLEKLEKKVDDLSYEIEALKTKTKLSKDDSKNNIPLTNLDYE